MKNINELRKIPTRSCVFSELIPMIIPDFHNHSSHYVSMVLSFQKVNSEQWFNDFVDLIVSKMGKEYFPVMRMSDGEYTFLLGQVYPYYHGHSLLTYLKKVLNTTKQKIFNSRSFKAATLPDVSSGNYSTLEIKESKAKIANQIKFIAEHGVMALHLTYSMKPFQEHFHEKLMEWFSINKIIVNQDNYFPFYFVYALLRGSHKSKIMSGKTVLIFHSAQGEKMQSIINSLLKQGVKEVLWHEISTSRSMFDNIELKPAYFKADIAFVGAGVGKFNVLAQLEPLGIPCIDAGFVFEVWANESNKWKRPMMVADSEWDDDNISF